MNQAKTDFVEIFQTIRASLQPFAAMGFDNRTNSESTYDLWSNKNVKIGGKASNEVFFASVSIKKKYVALYFMPTHAEIMLENLVDQELLPLLKGKSFFHIVALDELLLDKIENGLAAGFKVFTERNWI